MGNTRGPNIHFGIQGRADMVGANAHDGTGSVGAVSSEQNATNTQGAIRLMFCSIGILQEALMWRAMYPTRASPKPGDPFHMNARGF
jgi:hypothetical protein